MSKDVNPPSGLLLNCYTKLPHAEVEVELRAHGFVFKPYHQAPLDQMLQKYLGSSLVFFPDNAGYTRLNAAQLHRYGGISTLL